MGLWRLGEGVACQCRWRPLPPSNNSINLIADLEYRVDHVRALLCFPIRCATASSSGAVASEFLGVPVVGRADDEALAHALDEGEKHLAREFGVGIHHEHVVEPAQDSRHSRHVSRMITAASVAVAVVRVGTACNFLTAGRRGCGSCRKLTRNQAPRSAAGNLVHSIIPPRRDGRGGGCKDSGRAGRRAPPWCAGKSGTSARVLASSTSWLNQKARVQHQR